jgi:type I restriction enzyme S subunit
MTRHYPAYKDSGEEWLGQVPDCWTLKRLRFLATLNPSKSELAGKDRTEEVSFIPMEAVGENGELDLSRTRPIAEVETGYTYLRDGDMTFAKITPCFENGKRAIMRDLIGGIGFGTTELTVLRPRLGQTTTEYLFWLLSSPSFRKIGEASMYGAGGQKRVPDDFVRDFVVALPPLPEQTAITAFLDQETAKIDALVAEQRRLIDLLREKRQAVISHAVTKGLNPQARKKPSGIGWLGNVPEEWTIVPLKHLVTHVVDCLHTTPTYDGELLYPAIRTADVDRGVLLLEQARLVSQKIYDERIQRLKPIPNDILYSREGERLGMAALVPEGVDLCLGQRMMMFRAKTACCPSFLMWALNSEAVYQQVMEKNIGSTSPHVNIRDVINFRFPCPPLDEQIAIASFLTTASSTFLRAAKIAEEGIALLQERRAALISAAVTGKIDVRHLTAAATEAA